MGVIYVDYMFVKSGDKMQLCYKNLQGLIEHDLSAVQSSRARPSTVHPDGLEAVHEYSGGEQQTPPRLRNSPMKTRKAELKRELKAARCPPGCPKQRVIHTVPDMGYRDVHSAPPPGGCLDCTRKVPKHLSYRKPRGPYPPGSKPIPAKPLGGGTVDPSETFLDTFDCQEQPWRSSYQRNPSRHEYSHQALFRPSVGQGKLTGDSLGDFACAEHKPEWRSCALYIPCAHGYGKSWQWRSSVRHVGTKDCKEKDWRSSRHNTAYRERDKEKPYRSQLGVTGGAFTAGEETQQRPFRPRIRHIPEFYPNRRDWRPSRGHVCTDKCYHGPGGLVHNYNPLPAFETDQKLPQRDLSKATPLFFKEHPIKSWLYDIPAHDDPPDFVPHANEQGQLMPRSGKECVSWTTKSNPINDDGRDRPRRRVNSSWTMDNLDTSCRLVRGKDTFRPTIRIIDGPQHHSVVRRNVLAGPLEPGNEKLPRFRGIVPKPMAPQGTFNEDIISGRFHSGNNPGKEPLTEQRAQFTTCKPWIREEIYKEVNQAYKENRCNDSFTHPSLTRYLYEDRNAVVS